MDELKQNVKELANRVVKERNDRTDVETKLANLAKDYDLLSEENLTLKHKLKIAGAGDKKNE